MEYRSEEQASDTKKRDAQGTRSQRPTQTRTDCAAAPANRQGDTRVIEVLIRGVTSMLSERLMAPPLLKSPNSGV
jgi:hypothetical protein